jgi:hypothetical protein
MVMITLLVTPLKVADRRTHPPGTLTALTVKAAVTAPGCTIALPGAFRAGLLVDRPTVTAPAAFERLTVQVLLPPTVNAVGLQASDTSTGVDHNAKVTVFDVVPRVAVITPEASVVIAPAVALKPAVLVPARTVTLAGTVISAEFELRETNVFAAAVCDSVTVQAVIPADIKPVRLQSMEVICTGAAREIDTDWEEPL